MSYSDIIYSPSGFPILGKHKLGKKDGYYKEPPAIARLPSEMNVADSSGYRINVKRGSVEVDYYYELSVNRPDKLIANSKDSLALQEEMIVHAFDLMGNNYVSDLIESARKGVLIGGKFSYYHVNLLIDILSDIGANGKRQSRRPVQYHMETIKDYIAAISFQSKSSEAHSQFHAEIPEYNTQRAIKQFINDNYYVNKDYTTANFIQDILVKGGFIYLAAVLNALFGSLHLPDSYY